ncbi:hypothetical protein [Sporosarcina sp. NPDC096371]|uniref:hypothetical protein n=1 Tax=Sporosarcina sp. NPDC096371 TaxID=3364530 RepID=UPI0037F75897
MEQMLKKEYGMYAIPEEVMKLIRLEEELNQEGESLDTIGFRPIVHEFAYAITPPDLIPFAHTGGGGIHFGFLTEFDAIKDLHEAPIVCVSPTNDPPIRYVARNIQEFLDLASSVPHVEMIESLWPCENTTAMETIQQEYASELDVEWAQKRDKIRRRFQATFHTKLLPPQQYVQEVLEERSTETAIPTYDGLGVVGAITSDWPGRRYSFDDQRQQDEKELARMRHFLANATTKEQLAFVRDAYYWYILTPDYHQGVLNVVVELLDSLRLTTIVNRIEDRV